MLGFPGGTIHKKRDREVFPVRVLCFSAANAGNRFWWRAGQVLSCFSCRNHMLVPALLEHSKMVPLVHSMKGQADNLVLGNKSYVDA